MSGRLLTAEELAKRWQVPTSQVYRMTRAGRLPVVRLGRYYRYRPDVIERFERGERHEAGSACIDPRAGVGSVPSN